jgi:Tfp pilus assembly protein PilF
MTLTISMPKVLSVRSMRRTLQALVVLIVGMGLAACATPTPIPIATMQATAAVANTDLQQHLDAARATLKAGKFEEARTEAAAAVQVDPKNSDAQYLLGNAYNQLAGVETDLQKRQTDLTSAVDAYLAAIKLDPANDAAYTNLATVYYQNGQFDEAQKQVEQALKLKPNDSTSHYVLGTIYLQRDPKVVTDAFDKAQSEFEAAIKSEAKMGAAYIGLANVYLFKGDNKLATENAQKGIELTQGSPNPYSYWALAQAQCASGDKVSAARTITKINSLNPVDTLFKRQVQALADKCK